METKKRGRGRPRKTETTVVKPKGKRGRPRKVVEKEFYDISTNQIVKEPAETIIKELNSLANFIFTIHDGNEKGAAKLETSGNTQIGMRKIQEYYVENQSFREFINAIVNGAIQVKALRVAQELDSIV
jgi:hypothetical protein